MRLDTNVAGNLVSMCLNRDLCFFWVSSLAYPNLLGKKGYVVVAVVVRLDTRTPRNESMMLARAQTDKFLYVLQP